MIVCAAYKLTMNNAAGTEIIICGHRHHNCLATIAQLNSNWVGAKKVDGFINHKGEFLDRKEAYRHAEECGQLSATNRWFHEDEKRGSIELYSEDLY